MQLPARIGKYELEEFLGGGMSHVYRARDTVIDRTVAVKILTDTSYQDPDVKERFLREARTAGRVSHQNILSIYDFGADENGRPFLVMEFLDGQDLRHAIREGRLSLVEKLRIALDVARALDYIHSLGIIHRDIKPENIHITRAGTVKLMDFGISKAEGREVTRAGFLIGTPSYMAPEQITGQPVTPQTDVFAFGVLLFETVTGVKPFTSDSVEQLFYRVLSEPVNLEPMRQAGAPAELCDLVARCTAKNPTSRPAGFGSVCTELQRLQEQHSPFRPLSAAEPAPPVPSGVGADRMAGISRYIWIPAAAVVVAVVLWSIDLTALITQLPRPTAEPAWSLRDWFLLLAVIAAAGLGFYLWRRSKVEDTGSRAPAPAEPARTPPPPPLPTPAAPLAQEGATALFRTTPATASPPPSRPSPSASAPAVADEHTRVFSLAPSDRGVPSSAPAAASYLPDVALTITACKDLAYVGRTFPVSRFPLVIGSIAGSELALTFDAAISRQHAEVLYLESGFFVRDLGSHNGTFLNGKRLKPDQPEPLLFGSRILVGSNTELAFVTREIEELPDLTGQLIAGRYEISEKLSAGAASVSHKAFDRKRAGAVVLLKMLSPQLMRYPGYREQFEQEAALACRLDHSNIVRVLEYGETELGSPAKRSLYVSMEYLKGGSLARRLTRSDRFDLDRVARWLEELAGGLDYVHSENVIHGGIKPSSILFDAHDKPCLTDFAIAVQAGGKAAGTVIGAPAFLAPEQWEGADLTPATDQYSMACVFYLAITGSVPYEGQEHPEVRRRNFMRGPEPAHQLAAQRQMPALPPAISPVLARALSADPAQRYPSVAEFAQAFRAALTASPSTAPERPAVFISYLRAMGSAWALLFKNELEREYGCQVFVDAEQRDTVGQFPPKLESAIKRCHVFVCLLAEGSLDAFWVDREIQIAYREHKPMVPVMQESFRVPADLDALPAHQKELLLSDGVILFDRRNVYVADAIRSLHRNIRQLVSGSQTQSAGG